jgi:hypothetical protein
MTSRACITIEVGNNGHAEYIINGTGEALGCADNLMALLGQQNPDSCVGEEHFSVH